MRSVYVFPMRRREDLEKKSPYINHLTKYLSERFKVINYGRKPKLGVMDIFFNSRKADIFMFNWAENKTGIQGWVLWLSIHWLKLNSKKIVWTHHNVHPHKANSFVCRLLMDTIKDKSDKIIIHTQESKKHFTSREIGKMLYFFHPLFDRDPLFLEDQDVPKTTDILVWGRVRKSKGVDDFLQFMKERKLFEKYRVRVVGKFEEGTFPGYLREYSHDNLLLEDRFVTEEELNALHREAKFVFFPYTGSSVLNSGALISSIPRMTPIIGPRVGAFKELSDRKLIFSYDVMDDLENYLESAQAVSPEENKAKVRAFFGEYTWSKFSEFLSHNL
ncbi:glycosyltransferase [Echinicola soli]|uniref:Glycosyltransferase n=1 Tax=Echinicola soli TaxID=2591634 RepID=A0A514CM74_9BACT|nr:glycosyltransferase [Echinicola soli]QDH80804.1 glycosyltransferase [Echinicola soli]